MPYDIFCRNTYPILSQVHQPQIASSCVELVLQHSSEQRTFSGPCNKCNIRAEYDNIVS